jgi:phosphatidate cytidylyltransferase
MCGPFRLGNVMLLYVIAIVKFSDVGGFAFGLTSAKLMKGGNHKLCPTISPNKSWEGLLGSVAVSSLVSCLFMGATGFGWAKSLALGAAAALLGTAGDLVESKFKRWVGVKDSSAMKITNGLGGILDMIDSLLIAPPVLLAFL